MHNVRLRYTKERQQPHGSTRELARESVSARTGSQVRRPGGTIGMAIDSQSFLSASLSGCAPLLIAQNEGGKTVRTQGGKNGSSA
jgi:hypothetical protein